MKKELQKKIALGLTKKLFFIFAFTLIFASAYSQERINNPVPYKDSLNINKITVYEVSNFVGTDSTFILHELDNLARIKKSSKWRKGKHISTLEYFVGEESELFVKSIKHQEADNKLEIPAKLYTYFQYDANGNIIKATGKTVSDSILQETLYYYNTDNTINEILYSTVASRFRRSKPNGTIDTFEYNIEENIVTTIRKRPNRAKKVIKEDQIKKPRLDLSKVKNSIKEFVDTMDDRKTRTVFKFDAKRNVISQEGYMQLKNTEGIFGKESKIFTYKYDIEYREQE